MSWGESVRVETPEQIDFDLEVAGPGSRLVAQLLDWVYKWLILGGLALLGLFVAALAGRDPGGWSDAAESVFYGALIVVGCLVFLGYDIYFEGVRNGQTPGKRAAGIRVVRDTGGPIDVQQACIRNLVGLADFLPAFYGLGGLVMLLNVRGQRLGDMAAGTVVIRERHAVVPDDQLAWVVERAGNAYPFRREQLAHCEPGDLHVLESFFGRYGTLDPLPRRKLAANLCDIFLKKTGYQLTEPLSGSDKEVVFLAALYRDLDAQRRHG